MVTVATCPYLDTVRRDLIDFDMQKVCSVTLSPLHVYACLVCGKFFSGRGKHTHAYTHSVQAGHHVFINLSDAKVYCLPDMYEVTDASLADIKLALHPRFTSKDIASIDSSTRLCTDVAGASYLPGYIGINSLSRTDYITVVVHALAHVHPLRNFFLEPSNYANVSSALVHRFGQLIRRIWSPVAFKATASPIEFTVEVATASSKRFGTAGQPVDALEFLTWLLNTLHADLTAPPASVAPAAATVAPGASSVIKPAVAAPASGAAAGAKRPRPAASGAKGGPTKESIITRVFQGEIEVETLMSELAVAQAAEAAKTDRARRRAQGEYFSSDDEDEPSAGGAPAAAKRPAPAGGAGLPPPRATGAAPGSGVSVKFPVKQTLPYLMLSLDLPPTPLFKDDEGGRIIAQIPLYTLLSKFDGATEVDSLRGQYRERKRYAITRLPPYLLMAVKRLSRNAFFHEKNPSIVNFPAKNLELRPYVRPDGSQWADPATGKPLPAPEELAGLPVSELQGLVRRLAAGAPEGGAAPLEKSELVARARAALAGACGTKYDLVANVVHESPPETNQGTVDPLASGSYHVHVHHEAASGSSGGGNGGGVSSHGQWYEVRDLHVQEALPQMIGVSETCLMVYKRQGYAPPVSFS